MSHSDLEALLEQQGRELMRQLLQAHLDLRTQATITECVTDGGLRDVVVRAPGLTVEKLREFQQRFKH